MKPLHRPETEEERKAMGFVPWDPEEPFIEMSQCVGKAGPVIEANVDAVLAIWRVQGMAGKTPMGGPIQ